MNILFNASGCGLGSNGGSKTIIKSAETLNKLGHETNIWSEVNNYNWHKTDVPILREYKNDTSELYLPIIGTVSNPTIEKRWFDVIINVSVWDVESTINFPCENKVWWLRGYEKWVRGEQYLIDQIHKFVNAGGRIVVNSGWLVDKLNTVGIDSKSCWAGLDLDFWNDCFSPNLGRLHDRKIFIGGLWHHKHKTKNYHIFEQLQSRFKGNDKYQFVTLRDDKNNEELLEFYNKCDIWLALSVLEGFHQVPAEAALCGCLIVYNNICSGGCQDYCSPETAMPFDTFEELVQAIENPDFSRVEKMQEVLREKIGSRETNMKNFVELLK